MRRQKRHCRYLRTCASVRWPLSTDSRAARVRTYLRAYRRRSARFSVLGLQLTCSTKATDTWIGGQLSGFVDPYTGVQIRGRSVLIIEVLKASYSKQSFAHTLQRAT